MKISLIILIQLLFINFAFSQDRVQILTNDAKIITEISALSEEEIYTPKGNFKYDTISKIIFEKYNEKSESTYEKLKKYVNIEFANASIPFDSLSVDSNDLMPLWSQDKSKFYEILNRSNVKYIDFGLSKAQEERLITNPQYADIYYQYIEYFKNEFGFTDAIITDAQRTNIYQNSSSICDIMYVELVVSDFESQFLAVGFYTLESYFTFCDQSSFKFEAQLNVNGNTASFQRPLRKGFDKLFNDKPKILKKNTVLEIPNGEIVLPLEEASKHFNSTDLDDFEGAYELISISSRMPIKQFGIIKNAGKYIVLHIENNYLINDWKFGEYRGEFEELRANSVYKGFLLGNYKTNVEGVMILNENGIIEFEDISNGNKFKFIKYDFQKSSGQK